MSHTMLPSMLTLLSPDTQANRALPPRYEKVWFRGAMHRVQSGRRALISWFLPMALPPLGLHFCPLVSSQPIHSPGNCCEALGHMVSIYLPLPIPQAPKANKTLSFSHMRLWALLGKRKAGIWLSGNQICLVRKIPPPSQHTITFLAAAFTCWG